VTSVLAAFDKGQSRRISAPTTAALSAVLATLVSAGPGRCSDRRAAVVVTGIVGEADAIER
jgi:hypothetical protein